MTDSFQDKYIILFDGACNLCNGLVKFLIKRDKNDHFRFASLQSTLAKKLLKSNGLSIKRMDSIVLIKPNKKSYVKSDAILNILRLIPWYSWIQILFIFPKSIRDWGYDLLAKNRYKWLKKRGKCMVLTPKLKTKFLDL